MRADRSRRRVKFGGRQRGGCGVLGINLGGSGDGRRDVGHWRDTRVADLGRWFLWSSFDNFVTMRRYHYRLQDGILVFEAYSKPRTFLNRGAVMTRLFRIRQELITLSAFHILHRIIVVPQRLVRSVVRYAR